MAINVNLSNLVNLQNETTAVSIINNNTSSVETALTDALSLSGQTPNQMKSSLDMNNNQVLNLPNPATANSPLRLQDLSTFVGSGTVSNIPTGGTTGQALVKNSNTDYDYKWAGGVVTSVGLALPTDFTVTNSPVTGAGTLTGAWVTPPTGTGAVVRGTSPTITTPVISSITNTGTLTLPTSTDTLTGRATTDTFTNKTFDTAGTGNAFKINSATVVTPADINAQLRSISLGFGMTGINVNSANTDNAITITLPTGFTKFSVRSIFAYNPSTSLTTATAGVFTSTGGGGTTVVTTAALSSLTTNTSGASGSLFAHTILNVNSTFLTGSTLYYRIGTAQGSAATVDVLIQIFALP